MQELFFAGILLVVSGVLMTCVRAAVEHYRIFNSGVPVNARIIEQTGVISRRRTYIKVMWEYEYDNTTYTCQSKWYRDNGQKVGDRGTLLIKKRNPSKVYWFMSEQRRHIMKYAGIIITVIGILFLIGFFYMRAGTNLLTLE